MFGLRFEFNKCRFLSSRYYIGLIVNCSRKSNVTLKHERLEQTLTNTRDYDIQSSAPQEKLKEKATQLQQKANQLKNTASVGATEVGAAARDLASNASDLNRDAGKITGTGLEGLQPLAGALATAAKGGADDTSSLHYRANQLKGDTGNAANAIAVIESFKKVKDAYDDLEKEQKYKDLLKKAQESSLVPGTPEAKVKAVDDAWKQVKDEFETLCKAHIKRFATQVETNASTLKEAASTNKLQGPASDLKSAADTLKGDPSVTNARVFKEKYEKFKEAYDKLGDEDSDKTAVKDAWDPLKGIIDKANLTEENKCWKFWWIIVPSMVTMLSECSPKTDLVFYGTPTNPKNGMGGWRKYKKHVEKSADQGGGCASTEPTVHNWF